jgi:hypothetical protein
MAARYWKHFRPELPIPSELDAWTKFTERTSDVSERGTSMRRLLSRLLSIAASPGQAVEEFKEVPVLSRKIEEIEIEDVEKSGRPLKIIVKTLNGVDDLPYFFKPSPPIPVILIFDLTFMTHSVEGGYHAVLLISVDFDKEKIFVVDPMKVHAKEPDIYDLNKFKRSWVLKKNLVILVYPPDMTVSTGEFRDVYKQESLDEVLTNRKSR